jgi:hypothetical protein
LSQTSHRTCMILVFPNLKRRQKIHLYSYSVLKTYFKPIYFVANPWLQSRALPWKDETEWGPICTGIVPLEGRLRFEMWSMLLYFSQIFMFSSENWNKFSLAGSLAYEME